MKYIKMFGLLAVAAAALMAFAASASATTVTSPTGTTYTSTITAVNEGPVTLHGSFVSVACEESHVEGKIDSHGPAGTAKGNIATLSFGKCNYPVTVEHELAPNPTFGSLEVHAVGTDATKGVVTCPSAPIDVCQGTLTSSGTKVRIHTSVGSCTFRTTNTDIGVLTTTAQTGGHATLDIGAHGTGIIPRTEGNFLCGASGQWTGSYTVTTPKTLWLDHV